MTPKITATLLAALAVLVGCNGTRNSPAADCPSTDPAQYFLTVESTYGRPEPLSDKQRRNVAALVEAAGRATDDVWFVYLHANREGHCWASVYFHPDRTNGRLREGDSLFTGRSPLPSLQPTTQPSDSPSVGRYVQVVRSSTNDTKMPPSEMNLPFGRPVGLSDGEIVTIVDTARAALIEDRYRLNDVTSPVMSIEPQDNGVITVRFGWQVGPLSGSGRGVDLKRADGHFDVSPGFGFWIS